MLFDGGVWVFVGIIYEELKSRIVGVVEIGDFYYRVRVVIVVVSDFDLSVSVVELKG